MTTQLFSTYGQSLTIITCDYTGLSYVNDQEFKTFRGAVNYARKTLKNA